MVMVATNFNGHFIRLLGNRVFGPPEAWDQPTLADFS